MNMNFRHIYCLLTVFNSFGNRIVYGAVEHRPPQVSNGLKTNTSMYPHVVEVYIPVPADTGTYCGGSIISDRWILTSGYCNYAANDISATVGDNKKYEIKYTLRHPEYEKKLNAWNNGPWTYNNYLMLHTVEYITFGLLVMKIPLGSRSEIMDWRNGYVLTYGPDDVTSFITDAKESTKNPLFIVTVPLVSYKTCQSESYAGFREFTLMKPTEFCAGEYAMYPCGDSGSGILAEGRLIGIFTITHVSCDEKENSGPAIFASVVAPSIRDWICDLSGA